MSLRFLRVLFFSGLVLASLLASAALAAQSSFAIERVSVASDGSASNGTSYAVAISDDGEIVAFESGATNLVSGDTNSGNDIFVRDRQSGLTTRISVASDGTQANAGSMRPAVSADGSVIAFESYATNLVSGDTNNRPDIFVHNRQTGATKRVSVASGGAEGSQFSAVSAISADGFTVAFQSQSALTPDDTNGEFDIFVHDTRTGVTTRVSVASDGTQGNGESQKPGLSSDGRWVVFASDSSNLVSGDTNNTYDVFVHDRDADSDSIFDEAGAIVTVRISVNTGGAQGNAQSLGPSMSTDGRWIAFYSAAANLVSGDSNGLGDVFVHDRETGETKRVSVSSGGAQANGQGSVPSLSPEGRFVAFSTSASNLVGGDSNGVSDVFLHDTLSGQTYLISHNAGGAAGNNYSYLPALSRDAATVGMLSQASNLISGDGNGVVDVFAADVSGFSGMLRAPHRNNFTTRTPTLTWNRLTWALTYDIQIAETTNFSASLVYEGSTSGPELEHLVTQSLENGDYYWRVRGVGAGGDGTWSAASEFVVDAD